MTPFVFLSHRGVDKPRIYHFVLRLIDRKIPVWVDNYANFNVSLAPDQPRIQRLMLAGGIDPGTHWPKAIDEALMRASVIVVFWSSAWSNDRVTLAREHGVAIARARAGEARYLPVFLDDETTLGGALQTYRNESQDHVQGFNVARDGDQWTLLLDEIEKSLLATTSSEPATNIRAATTGASWEEVLRISQLDDALIVQCLQRMPEGPAVDVGTISMEVKLLFSRGTTVLVARDTVGRASRMVLRALPTPPRNRHAFAIELHNLRDPDRGLLEFWADAFDHACILGPRMVAALLLVAPVGVLRGAERKFAEILEILEAWQ